jgi:hypothetical protein
MKQFNNVRQGLYTQEIYTDHSKKVYMQFTDWCHNVVNMPI